MSSLCGNNEAQISYTAFHIRLWNFSFFCLILFQQNCKNISELVLGNTILVSFFFSCVTGEETDFFDLTDFKKKFKRLLRSALKNVRINPF